VIKKLLHTILLPKDVTQFELAYLRKLNRIALIFFAFHVPVFALVAWANHTRPAVAAILTTIALMGPTVAYFTFDNPRSTSVVHGISAMFMGALLVHFGQGPAQIEMHFYFFALIAMCAVFGNPMVIVAATVTVALHHLIVWLVLPSSVFNYEAQWWVVGIHALFVVLEATATCFIARSFFDNVIGLERIVRLRTGELDAANQDMRMVLDNVQQGFLTIDREGRLATQRSAAVDRWFGTPSADVTWFDYLHALAPAFEQSSRVAWEQVIADVMPLEVTLDQMPRQLTVGAATFGVEYRPIGLVEPRAMFQVCVTDITDRIRSECAGEDRREVMSMFERVIADRAGVEAFVDEGTRIVQQVRSGEADQSKLKRAVHTLKGTAAMFGLFTIAGHCHSLEDAIADGIAPQCDALAARWDFVVAEVGKLLGYRGAVVELDRVQLEALETAANVRDTNTMTTEILQLRLEPTSRRFRHVAEQAQQLASRLGKEGVSVRVESNSVRLEPKRWSAFWQTFVHGVRNAIDHGIEPASERDGKPALGTLTLRSYIEANRVVIEIEDDGRGVDWTKIADRARERGLACTTHQDLNAALFVGGLSTAAEVTEVSGRGIGMGALLAGTRALGGELDVLSVTGVGTTVRMKFPIDAAFGEARFAIAS
jgi:two-component system, chemotaxis family, sensor kinase CheA